MSVLTPTDSRVQAALADVVHAPLWTDRPDRPSPHPPLERSTTTDLLIIGAPHREYAGLVTDKPVIDIWNLRGQGSRV